MDDAIEGVDAGDLYKPMDGRALRAGVTGGPFILLRDGLATGDSSSSSRCAAFPWLLYARCLRSDIVVRTKTRHRSRPRRTMGECDTCPRTGHMHVRVSHGGCDVNTRPINDKNLVRFHFGWRSKGGR